MYTVKNTIKSLFQMCLIVIPFCFIKLDIASWVTWIFYACIVALYAGIIVLISTIIFDKNLLKGIVKRGKNILKRG